ncbi:hypothetical protein BXA52_18295, partial [Enterococcus faecium]
KEILALPNQKVVEWVQVNGLAIGQIYKLIVQGYLTPDGTPFEGTHAEKVFMADKAKISFPPFALVAFVVMVGLTILMVWSLSVISA